MSRGTRRKDLKRLMWERLSAEPETLDLDARADEEPEDMFVRLAAEARRPEVIRALNILLIEEVADESAADGDYPLRFLRRAIRLCDSLGAAECKTILKQIMLIEESPRWGDDLAELQELAARAMSGFPTNRSDFLFWKDVAQSAGRALPYALNAAIEIDLQRGLELFCTIHLRAIREDWSDTVDWEAIAQIAAQLHGEESFEECLQDVIADLPEIPDPSRRFAYYGLLVRLAGLPRTSRRRKREEELFIAYDAPHKRRRGSSSTVSLASDIGDLMNMLNTGTSERQLLGSPQRNPPESGSSDKVEQYPTGPWLKYHPAAG